VEGDAGVEEAVGGNDSQYRFIGYLARGGVW
jgi:hypothetical protein